MPAHAADPRPAKPDRRAQLPAAHYRLGWLLLLGAVALAEVAALITRAALDTLSETMWWAYGPQYSLRWWILGSLVAALLFWCPVHWSWPSVGGRHLAVIAAAALAVGLAGWAVTR